MTTEITMTGSGTIGDIRPGWSVSESSTPHDISSLDGGTGNVSVSAKKTPTSKFIVNNGATLSNDEIGSITGDISAVSTQGPVAQFNIAPKLSLLDAEKTAPVQQNATLSAVFTNYLALADTGLTLVYGASGNPTVNIPSWTGNLWNQMKALCAAHGVEMVATGSTIEIRDIGSGAPFLIDNSTPVGMQFNSQASGRNVDITYTNASGATNSGYIYNYAWNPSSQVNSVGYSTTSGSVTVSRSTARPLYGPASAVATNNTANSQWNLIYTETNVADIPYLSAYRFAISVLAAAGTSIGSGGNITVFCDVAFYDAGGNLIWSTASGGYQYRSTISFGGQPSAFNGYLTADFGILPKPPGTASIRLSAVLQVSVALSGTFAAGSALYMDAVSIMGNRQFNYFDGSSYGNTSWLGAVGNSMSRLLLSPVIYDAALDDNKIFSADVNEVNETTISGNFYPTYLEQPVPSSWPGVVANEYYVTDPDGLPIPPAEWQALGGSVTVSIGTVPGTIVVKMTGPSSDPAGHDGPYSLAQGDGSNQFAQFKISGGGVITNPQTVRLGTGADYTKTAVEVAATVESPFIDTIERAYHRGVWATVRAAGPRSTITASVATRQLLGFGFTPGSIIRYEDANWRITDVEIGNVETRITAEWYTTAGTLDSTWSGQTAGAIDTLWSGYEAQDQIIAPLRTS